MLAHDSKRSMLLQQPGQMGPLRLKNRVGMGPMGTNFGTTSGLSTERDKIYYSERALAWRLSEAGAARGWGLDAALKTPKCGRRTRLVALLSGTLPAEFAGVRWPTWRRFDPSSSPSAIDLGGLPSNSVDRPQKPQQNEAFPAE